MNPKISFFNLLTYFGHPTFDAEIILLEMKVCHSIGIILAFVLVFGAVMPPGLLAQAEGFTAGDLITLKVQDYALIDTNHAPVNLDLGPTVAGEPAQPVSNSDMFVKFSSIVPGSTNREVTVKLVSGTIPTGTFLSLQTTTCTTTNSGGRLGTPNPIPIYLNETDQILISLIGSCYTGTGYTDGYQLTFTWGPDSPESNYHLIESSPDPVNLTIVFTLTAHDGN